MNFRFLCIISIAALTLSACSQGTLSQRSLNALCEQPQWRVNNDNNLVASATVHSVFQQDNQLGGFFIHYQDNAAFVASDLAVEAGDRVAVQGPVSEFQGGIQVSPRLPVTHCGRADIDTVPLNFPLDDESVLETYLHQPVRIEQSMYVIDTYNLARFGIVTLASELLFTPTQIVTPGDQANQLSEQNARSRIVLDDGSIEEYPTHVPYPAPGLHIDNPLRRGDTTAEAIEGVLVRIGQSYHIHPTSDVRFSHDNPRPQASELSRHGDLRVAAFNVLNYFNGDGQGDGFPTPRGAENPEEFERQHARIVNALAALDADIYTLMEMENDGYDTFSAVATLTRALQAVVPDAEFAFVDPGVDQLGSDVITQAIIYRSDRVEPVGTAAFSEHELFTWGSRPPLAQTFRSESGGLLTVVANHFKSKGGCPQDNPANTNQNDGQACWNALRTDTAHALLDWVDQHFNSTGILLAGDFNAYAMEDPIQVMLERNYHNLGKLYARDGYSYVFRGEAGSLDHILAHDSLLPAVQAFQYWSVNADEPVAFEYPLSNKNEWQQQHWYSPAPYRSSDHDPIIVDLNSHFLPQDSTHD